nr:unnamed protein product [Spirometra erinaceieuropaei]
MALPRSRVFEDEFPMIRSCPLLNEIRLAREIKDLTIEVKDNSRLHAHRIILAARIPSLRAELSDPLEEKKSIVRWPRVPLSIATAFLNYVYTGQIEITQTNAKGLVMFAKMVGIPAIEYCGAEFMGQRCQLGQWTELAGMKEPRWHFFLLTYADAVFALGNDYKRNNTVETLTAPEGSADVGNNLKAWTWSLKNPLETLDSISGAVVICR